MGKIEEFTAFFDDKIARSKQTFAALQADNRQDEAILEKIKGNIYDIFRTVLLAAQKAKSDENAQRDFFRNNMNNIPRGWKIAYEKAEKNGDAVRLAQEKVKLEALREIEEAFARIWG
ncbi:MAG: hypothetical protein IJ766_02630 [Clostridia bacterium]|nr:hypothetical protein [Clostridia bacterium]